MPNYSYDAGSMSDGTHINAVIPLNSKGQISLSKNGPQREFNAAYSLRPNTNFSPIRAGPDVAGLGPSSGLSSDLQQKVRQLEMNLLDYKGTVDRKILAFSDELP